MIRVLQITRALHMTRAIHMIRVLQITKVLHMTRAIQMIRVRGHFCGRTGTMGIMRIGRHQRWN